MALMRRMKMGKGSVCRLKSNLSLVVVFCLTFVVSASVEGGPTVAKNKKASLAQELRQKPEHTLLWQACLRILVRSLRLEAKMLIADARRPVAAHRERQSWNAASILRIVKAYHYYTSHLSLKSPAAKPALRTWKSQMALLEKLAKTMQRALEEDKSPLKTLSALSISLHKSQATIPPLPKAKTLSPVLRKELLDTVGGFAAGAEMTSYFRMRQLFALLKKKAKSKAAKLALTALKRGLKWELYFFREIRRRYSEEKKNIRQFLYPRALLIRCISLRLKAEVEKDKTKKAKLQARLDKRMAQAKAFLAKTNPSFSTVWRSAADE